MKQLQIYEKLLNYSLPWFNAGFPLCYQLVLNSWKCYYKVSRGMLNHDEVIFLKNVSSKWENDKLEHITIMKNLSLERLNGTKVYDDMVKTLHGSYSS